MKATKHYRIKFHCRMSVIGMLAVIGLMAICGEPDASLTLGAWVCTFGCQAAVCAVCWLTAWLLCRRWNLNRIMSMLTWIERSRREY